MKPALIIASVLLLSLAAVAATPVPSSAAPAGDDDPKLLAVPFTDVTVDDAFWSPRLETTRAKTLPHNFKMCAETGRIDNFKRAAGAMEGKYEGYYFNDSDVYKAIEGAAYALAAAPDPELDAYLDDLIATIASAQQEDGYLNAYYTVNEPDSLWTNLAHKHELYCAGHLIEAAVAHHQATGKRNLLDVALRFADLIDSIFGPNGRYDVPGHEEIELALVKLWRLTGEERYFDLALFFLEQRGRAVKRELYGDYCQDHEPVREQGEIAGHAVRAMYLYCAVADVAAVTGDTGYMATMDRIWDDVVLRRMYITGGIGPSASNEGFTTAFDLPNDSAYAETCASIGIALWNHRLALLHGDARYADVMERVLYNGFLSGVSLDGETFFYTNPLGSRGNHHRSSWFGCACCPPNVLRILSSLGGWIYARDSSSVCVNLYAGSSFKTTIHGEPVDVPVTITQKTRYPWEGKVAIAVEPARGTPSFVLCLRIPGWCESYTLELNGEAIEKPMVEKGYARISRIWKSGDVVELDMAMSVRRVESDPRVKANVGRAALMRGPLVYCLEGADNGGKVRNLALPRRAELSVRHCPDLLGGVTVIEGRALAVGSTDWDGRLYAPAAPAKPVNFTAVPYYAWDNREAGEMVVWLPEAAGLVEPQPAPGITASASHCYGRDTLLALHDRTEPESSRDPGVRRFTWWPHRGTAEWVQVDFEKPRTVASVDVYWFKDAPHGGCSTPASWTLLYKAGDAWKPVEGASAFGTEPDRYNRVTFDPVETTGLRIDVQLQEDLSSGILEWRVGKK